MSRIHKKYNPVSDIEEEMVAYLQTMPAIALISLVMEDPQWQSVGDLRHHVELNSKEAPVVEEGQ